MEHDDEESSTDLKPEPIRSWRKRTQSVKFHHRTGRTTVRDRHAIDAMHHGQADDGSRPGAVLAPRARTGEICKQRRKRERPVPAFETS